MVKPCNIGRVLGSLASRDSCDGILFFAGMSGCLGVVLGLSGLSGLETGFSGFGNSPGKVPDVSVGSGRVLLFFENGLVLGGFSGLRVETGLKGFR